MCRHWDVAFRMLGQGGVHSSLCKGMAMAGLAEPQVLGDFRDICGCLLSHCDCGIRMWRDKLKGVKDQGGLTVMGEYCAKTCRRLLLS